MVKSNLRLIAAAVAVALSVTLPPAAAAADLTVAQGDSATLSNGDSYDAIIVNGALTIPANAAVTAASLTVANTAVDATVTLEGAGASLTLSGDVHLGYDGGQARLNIKSGASMTVGGNLYMANGHRTSPAASAEPTRAYLTVSNATVTIKGSNGLYFYHSQYWPSSTDNSTVVDIVRLEKGAVLKPTASAVTKNCEKQRSARSSSIVFAGGCIEYGKRGGAVMSHLYNAAYASLNLVAENCNPIHLKGTNAGAPSWITWFNPGSKSCWFSISGDGDLFLENINTTDNFNWSANNSYWDPASPNVKFRTGGRIRLSGGNLAANTTNAFSSVDGNCSRSLILEKGATLDLMGIDVEFPSFNDIDGTINNSPAAACSLTIGGDGADIVHPYPLSLPPGVTLVKAGAGTLSLFASDAGAVSVQGGSLALLGRAEMGYPFYRFNVYRTSATGVNNHQVRISEFKFLDGGTDVTRGWNAYYYSHAGTSYYSEPTNMWDEDLTTDFYDQRDQYWGSVSNIHATLEYRPSRKVTGYTWHVSGFTGGSDGGWSVRGNTPPTAWAVFGSLDNADWTRLDLVEGFRAAGQNPGAWCGTNFVCTYETTMATFDALALASGTPLSVDGASVAVTSVAAASAVPVTLAHGATLTLPAATEIASLTVDVDGGGGTLTNFRPADGGAVYLTGDVARPNKCVLPVHVETLLGDNLAGWRVYCDGQQVKDSRVFVDGDGCLATKSVAATVLCVR